MTTALSERTLLPPEQPDRLVRALGPLSRGPALIAADGTTIELPTEVFEMLRDVIQALSQGMAITIAPHNTVLTTSEAAALLGISRPTVVRLVESGELPYLRPGKHRRLRLADVLAYRERARRARAAGLDEMVRVSEENGLYDLPDDVPFERLSIANKEG